MPPRNIFSPGLRRSLLGTLAKTVHANTRHLEASGVADVKRVSGTPPEGPTERLNVRLRRYTIVLTAHDHIELGTYMLCSMVDALPRIVRHGRSALSSMLGAHGAKKCTPTLNRAHI
jgi:hypothetical protein